MKVQLPVFTTPKVKHAIRVKSRRIPRINCGNRDISLPALWVKYVVSEINKNTHVKHDSVTVRYERVLSPFCCFSIDIEQN